MEAQHALKGRQKLEDLRHKKATSLSGELEAMTIQFQMMEEKLQHVEAERDLLRRQKEETVVKVESIQNDLSRARVQVSQDEKTVAMLRKSLDTVTMERDAAFISWTWPEQEDMVAQLRLMKRRLQEAEEEKYKAEEDAAAVRAEIKLLQANEDQSESLGAISDQLRLAEQHNNALQKDLQVRFIKMFFDVATSRFIRLFVYSFLNGFRHWRCILPHPQS